MPLRNEAEFFDVDHAERKAPMEAGDLEKRIAELLARAAKERSHRKLMALNNEVERLLDEREERTVVWDSVKTSYTLCPEAQGTHPRGTEERAFMISLRVVDVNRPWLLKNSIFFKTARMGDRKCLGELRKSFVGHPDTILFSRISRGRVFQHLQAISLIDRPDYKGDYRQHCSAEPNGKFTSTHSVLLTPYRYSAWSNASSSDS